MSTSLTPGESDTLTLGAVDAAGNALADGLSEVTGIAWSESSGGAVIALVVDESNVAAGITAVGIGDSTVTVSGTLADGTSVSGDISVAVLGPVAALVITAGDPTDPPAEEVPA